MSSTGLLVFRDRAAIDQIAGHHDERDILEVPINAVERGCQAVMGRQAIQGLSISRNVHIRDVDEAHVRYLSDAP